MLNILNMRMKKYMKWVLVTTLICSLFVWMSCSNDDNVVIPQPGPKMEFGALLKTLDWGSDTCFVYGHKTPDVDAVTSALTYVRLMRQMGYNCKAKVSGVMNRETDYIAHVFGFALPEVMAQQEQQIMVAKIDEKIENTGDDRDTNPYVRDGMYFIYYGEGAREMSEAIFGTSLRKGICYTPQSLSRKQVVPLITSILNP